ADEVLHDYSFVPRDRPQDRSAEARKFVEYAHHARSLDATDNDVGQSGETVIRRAQQRAPQSNAVAGKRERYDLPSAVGQKLETARPSPLKDVGHVANLTFVHKLLAGFQSD